MKKLPITVLIPTLNAEGHLNDLLNSIEQYVEDVFIVDSFSIDKTVDIALERNVKILQRHYVTSSNQFRWMLKNLPIKTPWIFFMAQDERFSESLLRKMAELFEKDIPENVCGYTVNWRLWFMGRPLHASAPNLRLLRTGKCDVSEVACNEHFLAEGDVLHLNGMLEHKDTLTMHDWYEKQNLWTTREAIQRVKPPSEDEKPNLFGNALQRKSFCKECFLRTPLRSIAMTLYYFLKFGAWKDGLLGWQWARLRVWVWDVTLIKEREMKRYGVPKKIPEGRHGTYDPRVLASALQQELLPETICEN